MFLCRPLVIGLLALLVTPTASKAQSGTATATVTGKVTAIHSGDALAGVNISIDGSTIGTASDVDGTYRLANVPAGRHIIIASSLGFASRRRTISIRSGESVIVDFALEEESIDVGEVIVTARESLTGGNGLVRDLPGSAHFVGPEQLERFADNDIHRVLREIPGANVQEEDGYGLRPNIGLRGTGSERSSKITVMEDGVLIAPAPYAASAAYYFPTVGRMSGVEVRKGASQIRNGPYTTGGSLNLISRPIPNRTSGFVSGYLGSNRTRNAHAWVGSSGRHFGFVAETHLANVRGFKQLLPLRDANTGFDKQDYLAKLRLNSSGNARIYQSLTMKVSQTSELSHETYLGLTESDFATSPYVRYAGSQVDEMDALHRQRTLRHVAVFNDRFDVTTTVYRNTFHRNWYKLDSVSDGLPDDTDADGVPFDRAVGIASVLDQPAFFADELSVVRGLGNDRTASLGRLFVKNNNRDYVSQGVQSVAGYRHHNKLFSSEVEVGVRIHRDQMDRYQWVDEYAINDGLMRMTVAGEPGTESNRIESADAVAAFVQSETRAGIVTLTPGVRFEHIAMKRRDWGRADPERQSDPTGRENTVDVVVPGIAASVQVSTSLNVFGGVHRGFAPPNTRPGVRPETSLNLEAGLRIRNELVTLQAATYFNRYTNLLGADLAASGGGGTTDLFNGGRVNVAGFELSAGTDLATRFEAMELSLPFRFTYSFVDASFRSSFESEFEGWNTVGSGDALPYVARHQFAASAGIDWDRFGLDVRANYVGPMRTEAGSADISLVPHTDGRTVLDLSGSVALVPQSALFFGVRNVTDAVYVVARRPSGLRPGLPRTVLIGLRSRF